MNPETIWRILYLAALVGVGLLYYRGRKVGASPFIDTSLPLAKSNAELPEGCITGKVLKAIEDFDHSHRIAKASLRFILANQSVTKDQVREHLTSNRLEAPDDLLRVIATDSDLVLSDGTRWSINPEFAELVRECLKRDDQRGYQGRAWNSVPQYECVSCGRDYQSEDQMKEHVKSCRKMNHR
jgi:Zn ribbon nucleic-acid-binding protein